MTIADRAVLVTRANRGIGQALVDDALRRGARRVYADDLSDRAALDGVENGDEEIFPDAMSESMADSWRSGGAKALERQYAALAEAAPGRS